MASQVNKRFVFLLITICTGIAVLVGGLAFWAYRQNASRNISAGDAYMAEGEYELAADQYGRAVRKEMSDLAYLGKYESALLRIPADTQSKAEENYQRYLAVLLQRTKLRPEDVEFQLALIEELHNAARLSNSGNYWNELSTHADRALERIDPESPGGLEIRGLKLIADTQRARALSETEGDQIEVELEGFLRDHPEHVQARAIAASWHVDRANEAALADRRAEAQSHLQQAEEHVEAGRQVGEPSFELAVAEAQVVYARSALDRTPVEVERRRELSDAMDASFRAEPDVYRLSTAATMLPALLSREGYLAAVELAETYRIDHPDQLLASVILSRLHFDLGNLEEARELADTVLNSPAMTTSFMAQIRYELRRQAAKTLFDVAFLEAGNIQGDQQRRLAAIDLAREARDRVARLVAEPANDMLVRECDAWLAYVDAEYSTAASKFNDVIESMRESGRQPTWRMLWAAADSLQAEEAHGAARRLLSQAVAQAPGNGTLLSSLARLEFRLGEFDAALAHAQAALAIDANDQTAEAIRAQAANRLDQDVTTSGTPTTIAINRAEALLRDGDGEAAAGVIEEALADDPENVILQVALVQAQLQSGRRDEAIARLEMIVQQHPNDRRWREMLIRAQSEDDVAMIEQLSAARFSDPGRRALATWTSLRQMARMAQMRADAREAAGEDASEARRNAERYRQAAAPHHEQIPAELHNSFDYLNEQMNEAISAKDFSGAERLVALAREHDADQARGLTFKARLEVAQSRFEPAIVALDDASRIKPYSAWIWRTLGYCYQQLGNTQAAINAYAEAIKQQPNDLQAMTLLAGLYVETGQRQDALALLRPVASMDNVEAQLLDQWLALEGEVGDGLIAITKRREMYSNQPDDQINALRLAGLLGTVTPDRRSVLDSNDEPRFSEREWLALRPAEREAALGQVRDGWRQEAEQIFGTLNADTSDDLRIRLGRAIYLRDIGQTQQAIRLMREFVDEHGESRKDPQIYLSHAQFLNSIGDGEAAIATLHDGLQHQGASREVDHALAASHIIRNEYEQALGHLESVYEATRDPTVRLQIIESQTHLNRFADAEVHLREAEEEIGTNYQIELLRARIKLGQARDAGGAGDESRASRLQREALVAIDTARQLRPSDPWPPLLAASALYHEFIRTGRRTTSLLTDADVELTKALDLQSSFLPARRLRSEIMLAKSPPDYRGAMTQFEVILEQNPRNDPARSFLVNLAERAKDRRYAISVAEDGIEVDPAVPTWYVRAAHLHSRDGDHRRASELFRQAFERTGLLTHLQGWGDATIRAGDAATVVATLEQQPAAIEQMLSLRTLLARALADQGQWDRAVEEIKRAYHEHKKASEERDAVAFIAAWFTEAREMYRHRTIEELDALVRELSAGEMTQNERFYLATSWLQMGGIKGVDPALTLLNEALDATTDEDHNDRAVLYLQVGRASWLKGDYSSAVEAYKQSLQYGPDRPETLNDLAYTLVAGLEQPADALPYAERAATLAPDNAAVLDTLGTVYLKLDRLTEAEQQLRRSIDLDPMADNYLHMAALYHKRGDVGRARQYLDEASKLNPNDRTRADIAALLDDINS